MDAFLLGHGVLYKHDACVLLLDILAIVNLDWSQHARRVRGVCEGQLFHPAKCTSQI